MSQIKISNELFFLLVRYHLLEDDEPAEEIRRALSKKVDALAMRDLYTKSKTAPTEEERERARQTYLDKRGVPKDFRW